MVVMVVSMVVYTLIPFSGFGMKLLSRIILLPFVAGISYELIRFAAKRRGSFPGHPYGSRALAATHHHQAAVRRAGRRSHTRA